MSDSGQKFIARNRAPRVQIEYDVEVYGSEKKVELPLVVGVMADLLGQQETPPPKVDERKFLDFDHDNFDSRLKAMKPRLATSVKNRITNEGTMPVDITFASMEDFSPAAVARNVAPLRRLLDARKRLSDLVTFMDGRGDAEALIAESLRDPRKLLTLVGGANGSDDEKSVNGATASEASSTGQPSDEEG